jgi:hypothetical protein
MTTSQYGTGMVPVKIGEINFFGLLCKKIVPVPKQIRIHSNVQSSSIASASFFALHEVGTGTLVTVAK